LKINFQMELLQGAWSAMDDTVYILKDQVRGKAHGKIGKTKICFILYNIVPRCQETKMKKIWCVSS
jgi:hypothetical protein